MGAMPLVPVRSSWFIRDNIVYRGLESDHPLPKARQARRAYRCGVCHVLGHNLKSCPMRGRADLDL